MRTQPYLLFFVALCLGSFAHARLLRSTQMQLEALRTPEACTASARFKPITIETSNQLDGSLSVVEGPCSSPCVSGPGRGGIITSTCKKYKVIKPIQLYRVGSYEEKLPGIWWTLYPPTGMILSEWRNLFEICPAWNPEPELVIRCTIPAGTEFYAGQGESVENCPDIHGVPKEKGFGQSSCEQICALDLGGNQLECQVGIVDNFPHADSEFPEINFNSNCQAISLVVHFGTADTGYKNEYFFKVNTQVSLKDLSKRMTAAKGCRDNIHAAAAAAKWKQQSTSTPVLSASVPKLALDKIPDGVENFGNLLCQSSPIVYKTPRRKDLSP